MSAKRGAPFVINRPYGQHDSNKKSAVTKGIDPKKRHQVEEHQRRIRDKWFD
ncbi:hypothetical protein HBA55_35015 [Pseudomaricurvus alkylphenolicus]|uniref:hypothetical protein n=1 Tax=Pseudomaricurvus alkylphenolicus TaxID=1306991 RepID=UPI001423BB16|nr:hypothetical protein [Pseudomaricurvus alkylphenolicus]NIB44845.1 hypothetical protein [Pseudomaricurvus alkylphenolicus]